MMHLIRKLLKLLNLPESQNFTEIRKIVFSVKLPRGLEIVLHVTQDKKMCLFV